MTPVLVNDEFPFVPGTEDDDDDQGGGGGPGSDTTAVHTGDAAGGDLIGTYPNPQIDPDLLLGGSSITQDDVDATVADEATLRAAADTTLTTSVSAEATARAAAISSEASTRSAADATLTSSVSTLTSSISAETTARSAGDTAVLASSVQNDAEQINVLKHGLSNNGSTDNKDAWNTLIAAINAGTYSNIFFPAGTYIFSATPNEITATNFHIHGTYGATILKSKSTNAVGTFFQLGKADGSNSANFGVISNFVLQCNAAGTGFEPNALSNAIHLLDGGHLVVENLIVQDVGGLILVGSHIGTQTGTISSRSGNTLTMTAAHGLSAGDPIIFTSTGTVPTGLTSGQLYYVIAAGLTTTALRVSVTSGGTEVALSGDGTGTRTFDGKAFNARVQRYQVRNIIGTFNENTVNANKIWVLNGTAGAYSNIEVVAHNVQGGAMIKNQPVTNNDQHWFTDVHMQGGSNYWVNIDVSSGDCYNWVFKQCVMDGSLIHGVFIHADRAANTATDVHFVDCHCSTWGTDAIYLNHNGTQDWRSLQWIGGRYKWLNGDGSAYGGVRIGGSGASGILSANFQGVNFLADHLTITGLNATNDTLNVTVAADGRGHGLNVGDKVVFNTTTNGITSNTAYLVYSVSASGAVAKAGDAPPNDTFQIQPSPATGVPVDITGTFGSSFTLQGYVQTHFIFTSAQAVRINSCHFGAFYGTPTYARYAITAGGGTENYYNVQGNVARGLAKPTGVGAGGPSFSDGSLVHDATLPQLTVYYNNVSDTGTT